MNISEGRNYNLKGKENGLIIFLEGKFYLFFSSLSLLPLNLQEDFSLE